MDATSAPCPHCSFMHDVAYRVNGDRVWCTICDGWFLVRFAAGGVQLLACDAPAYWPEATRTTKEP